MGTPLPGIPTCGVTTASAVVSGPDLGAAQNDRHGWGSCLVQDFNGGPFGWVIVSYTAGTHLVRNGMLWGWFDNAGAPGAFGCPTTNEYTFGNGVRQDFIGGSLVWYSGWDHAQLLQSGPGGFANANVATWMLNHAPGGSNGGVSSAFGAYLGDCRDAVNADVLSVSGGQFNLEALNTAEWSDYNAGFERIGAYRVPSVTQAIEGDIVQVGNGVHTYVVVRNFGGGTLEVVDSNHLGNGLVMHYYRNFNYNDDASISTIWRVGHI